MKKNKMESEKVFPLVKEMACLPVLSSHEQGVDIGGRDRQTSAAHWPISVSNRGAQSSVVTLFQNIRSRKLEE